MPASRSARQVLGHPGRGDAGPAGQLGRRGRRLQLGQQERTGAAEHRRDRLGARHRAVRPQRAGAPGRVGELRRRRWPRPGEHLDDEHGRHQHEPRPGAVAGDAAPAVHEPQGVVVPAQSGVQVVEEMARAVLGDLPGTVEQVGVEQHADLRPVRSEGQLPVRLDLFGHPGQTGLDVCAQRPDAWPVAAGEAENAEVGPDLVGRCRADGGEFGRDRGGRRVGRRREEVGEVVSRAG